MYTNIEPGLGKKLCGGGNPNQEKLYCSTFVGCCGDKCCTTEDLTFIFVWAAVALFMILVITCMICVFKKRRKNAAKMSTGSTGKQNMANVFNVVIANDRKIYNPKMAAGKARRLEVRPLLRVSESSCGSDQQDLTMPKSKV